MIRQIVNINWRYIGDAVPAFVTVMFIPFGYSAAYGLIAGLMTYATLNGMVYVTKLVSRGRIVPDDEDDREYWTSELRPAWSLMFRSMFRSLTMHLQSSRKASYPGS
jgi:adenine/guanine/hypoxanthine permease